MEEREFSDRADELEGGATNLSDQSAELDREISETQRDWEAKKADESVPGAQPSEEEPADEVDPGEGGEAAEAAGQ